ncbi:unnamed protein product (macronuclear) [Paramecium tetraurelia]|uniref:Tetratricopeptide repeat protein n=1 Tax=Paramecium tetraurelia TaxID=5888 RepID=A0E678_PARTE|nr:uncharacterized protein GSPATT00003660001 [Paramecium tetraurelia]CAK90795.1 unnamed protein product [Paramecium tetraurelia]|eukprot:XP_001458192.1 hypothetical protein (macronuclear) [Paramecium tetraurelia strain d4-2]
MEDGVKECSKLPEWLQKQQDATKNFQNNLGSIVEKIYKPIKIIEKTLENQLEILSESNLKNLTYTDLNEAIRKQVNLGIVMDLFSKSCFTKGFDMFGGMLDRVQELMTESNITFSTCQRRLNSILMYLFVQISPFSSTGSFNSTIQLQSIGNNNQPQTNLCGFISYNQIQDNLQDPYQQSLQSLSRIYDDNINTQIDFKTDATFQDAIEYLMAGENEKAQSIFYTLQNQQPKQEVQLWLAYCMYVQRKYSDTMKFMQQLGQSQEEIKQNPFFWQIISKQCVMQPQVCLAQKIIKMLYILFKST